MKRVRLFILITFSLSLLSCVSIKPTDLNYLVGNWKLDEKVDNELWLERVERNENGIFSFNKNGTVVFYNEELKSKEELKKEFKNIQPWCLPINFINGQYKIVVRVGKWGAKKDIISIRYFKGKELHNIKFRIKYIRENNLDIEKISLN